MNHQPSEMLTQMRPLHWDIDENKNNNISSSSPLKDFVDFSASKREEHRQLIISSAPQTAMKRHAIVGGLDFECLEDEELDEMFQMDGLDLKSLINNNRPILSDDNNNNICEERKNIFSNFEAKALEEAEGEGHEDPSSSLMTGEAGTISDLKRQKRILANRQSAQRSRVRKLHYITDLENKVTTLQHEVSALGPRVQYLDHQRSLLAISNSHLKQRIAALTQDKKFKDAHHDSLRKEIERLTQLQQQQNAQKMVMQETEPVLESDPGPGETTEIEFQTS